MKTLLLLIVIAISISSCSKRQYAEVVEIKEKKSIGTFVFYNQTKDTYRIELWRYDSGGAIPVFYYVNPGQSMVVANTIAGKWVIGILQMSGYKSEEERVDYGITTVLQANCFFDWFIQ